MGGNCARKRQWYTPVSHFYPVWQEQCHGSGTSTYCLQSCTHTVVGYLVHDNNFRSAVSMYMSSWHALFDDGRSVTNLFVREMQTNEIHEKSIFLPFWCLLVPPLKRDIIVVYCRNQQCFICISCHVKPVTINVRGGRYLDEQVESTAMLTFFLRVKVHSTPSYFHFGT